MRASAAVPTRPCYVVNRMGRACAPIAAQDLEAIINLREQKLKKPDHPFVLEMGNANIDVRARPTQYRLKAFDRGTLSLRQPSVVRRDL